MFSSTLALSADMLPVLSIWVNRRLVILANSIRANIVYFSWIKSLKPALIFLFFRQKNLQKCLSVNLN